MKKFNLTTNQLLDYLIEKLVQGEEVYIDLITKDISTSFLCLDDIESKEQRKTEAHKLLDCLRDKPLYTKVSHPKKSSENNSFSINCCIFVATKLLNTNELKRNCYVCKISEFFRIVQAFEC